MDLRRRSSSNETLPSASQMQQLKSIAAISSFDHTTRTDFANNSYRKESFTAQPSVCADDEDGEDEFERKDRFATSDITHLNRTTSYTELYGNTNRSQNIMLSNRNNMYRRGSLAEASLDILRTRKTSTTLASADEEMDEAFAAYREREKRRKSSVWRTPPKRVDTSQTKQNVAIIALMIVAICIIVIGLSIYIRNTRSKEHG